jgi:hypothetical protein
MPNVSIPRMTKPWKRVAVTMAVFGFFYGYVGTAGDPCQSLGSCLQSVVDRGLAGFSPEALIPGAIAATIFAAVLSILFLPVYGARKALHRQPPAPDNRALATEPTPAVRHGPKPWRPTPLLSAVAAALLWAVVSVGPANLAADSDSLIPRDTVTAPSCPNNSSPAGPRCSIGLDLSRLGGAAPDLTDPGCFDDIGLGLILPKLGAVMETDGMCHERSGGTIEPLMGDIFRGFESALLAFLVVGAALLLWPRLRTESSRPGGLI